MCFESGGVVTFGPGVDMVVAIGASNDVPGDAHVVDFSDAGGVEGGEI